MSHLQLALSQICIIPTGISQSHSLFAAADDQVSWVFIELGAAVIGLAVLARLAHRLGFSAIPLYLLGGLAFGNGGLLPLQFSQKFVHVGAEIGVILLLFMLAWSIRERNCEPISVPASRPAS
jgi:NhaP-type Na+/H+ or K+/H+ antiporter